MPPALICVPITVEDPDDALADAARARDAGANLVEFRVDPLFDPENDQTRARILRLPDQSPLPCIITCRPAYEGGHYEGPDEDRVALLESLLAAPKPPKYIDFEFLPYSRSPETRARINAAVRAAPADDPTPGPGLILSAHDFNARPKNLLNLLTRMRGVTAARVLKLAFRARSLRDNLEIFDLLTEKDRPTIAIGMGEFGLLSRVLAPKFGAFLTFASLRDTSATAPGQPTIRDLLSLYRFREITRDTRVYGVIGHPVSHSIGPHVHNAGFEAAQIDAVYLPMPVPPEWEHFKATLLALLDAPHLDFAGASVTIPHKEHLLRLAREDTSRRWIVDDVARRVGAANTLVVHRDKSCRITNTDVEGVVEPLRRRMGDLAEKRIAILGAGGAARAAAAGLTETGATVVVYARRREQAEELVGSIDADPGTLVVGPWEKLGGSCCEAYVNCTPLGMAGGPDPSGCPLPDETFQGCASDAVVFDTVYNPVETPLVRNARERGLEPITGQEMFVAQAASQFTLWADRPAPIALFARVSQETLASAPSV